MVSWQGFVSLELPRGTNGHVTQGPTDLRRTMLPHVCRSRSRDIFPPSIIDRQEPTLSEVADLAADLQSRIDVAQAEGLEANVLRWLAFRGVKPGEAIELQALNVPDGKGSRWTSSKFAHAIDAASCVRLLTEADGWLAPGIYALANAINQAVATRKEAGRWHDAPKGVSTQDRDIDARCVLYIDVDVDRPAGTSSTDEDLALAHVLASRLYADLGALLGGTDALAFGHSGNGRSIFMALNRLAESAELKSLVVGILAAVRLLYQGGRIKIDVSVVDAKRLVPAFGTMKRKGAPGIAAYPHRRSALVTPEQVTRLGQAQLADLLGKLRERLDPAQLAALDKETRRPGAGPAAPQPAAKGPTPRRDGNDPYLEAKQIPMGDVLEWLGLGDAVNPVCPGCGLTGDSSVAVVKNGLKCSHQRCAHRGVPGEPGFRTTIDVVMENKNVGVKEAAKLLAERFDFAPPVARSGPAPKKARVESPADAPCDDEASALDPIDDLAARLEALPKNRRSGTAITDDDLLMAIGLSAAAFTDLCERLKSLGVQIGSFKERVKRARAAQHRERAEAPAADAWESRLVLTRDGDLIAAPANAITILRNDINWRGVLAWDDFTQSVIFKREPAWCLDDAPATSPVDADSPADLRAACLDDVGTTRIASWLLRRYGLNLQDRDVYKAALTVAKNNTVNSLRDWLDGLQWDGVPRLNTWLADYLGVTPGLYATFVGRSYLVSAVARVYVPGCQVDTTLILEGAQSAGKSSALRALFGTFFSESALDLSSKDRFTNLRGIWCQSFDEMASLRRSDADNVKNFLSSPFDVYRPPYAAHPVRVNRSCVFAGTINPPPNSGYLKDPTGNRRFWPVETAAVHPMRVAELTKDREQLWAEAVEVYRTGVRWHPVTDEEKALCRGEQEARQEVVAWEELLDRWLSGGAGMEAPCDRCGGSGHLPQYAHNGGVCLNCTGSGRVDKGCRREPGVFVTIDDVLGNALGIPVERRPQHHSRVSEALARLGWNRGTRLRLKEGGRVTPYYEPGKGPDDVAPAAPAPVPHPAAPVPVESWDEAVIDAPPCNDVSFDTGT